MSELIVQEREIPRMQSVAKQEFSGDVNPSQLLSLAVQQGADLAKMEKLMDLKERWEKNEARKAFVAALSAFKAAPPDLSKNKHVRIPHKDGRGFTEYDHATLDHVSSEIGKALAKQGMSHRWDVEQMEGGVIKVTCVLQHILGHSERVTLQSLADTSGSKNSIQAIGSTISYLQRYTLMSATGVAAKDQDDDGQKSVSAGFVTDEQAAEIKELLQETNSDVKRFLGVFGIENVDVMPSVHYQRAINMLNKKKEKASANTADAPKQ